MDSTSLTAPQVARVLGVSLPTAHRALDDAGVPRVGRGSVRTVTSEVVDEIVARRGAAPRSAYSPSELRVLAALSRSPLGQPSARAVATKAGVSPTTASRVLETLAEGMLVARRDVVVASGRARHQTRWFAATDQWPEALEQATRQTRLPEPETATGEPARLPAYLWHLFWNANVSDLDPARDGSYIAGRLLQAPDLRAWRWALSNLRRADIDTAIARRGVSDRTRALVRNWRADER